MLNKFTMSRTLLPGPSIAVLRFFAITSMLAALLVAVNGCISLKPASGEQQYYLLTGSSSNVSRGHTGPARVVRLLPVEMPDYLETRNMAVRTGSNEIIFPTFHEWAEPLDMGIRRVLAEDLRASPAIRDVLTDEPPPADAKVYTILIHILSCEGNSANGQSSILFKAEWGISESEDSTPFARGTFSTQPNRWKPGDYSDLANQMSAAVEDLCRELNRAITNKAMMNDKR